MNEKNYHVSEPVSKPFPAPGGIELKAAEMGHFETGSHCYLNVVDIRLRIQALSGNARSIHQGIP